MSLIQSLEGYSIKHFDLMISDDKFMRKRRTADYIFETLKFLTIAALKLCDRNPSNFVIPSISKSIIEGIGSLCLHFEC